MKDYHDYLIQESERILKALLSDETPRNEKALFALALREIQDRLPSDNTMAAMNVIAERPHSGQGPVTENVYPLAATLWFLAQDREKTATAILKAAMHFTESYRFQIIRVVDQEYRNRLLDPEERLQLIYWSLPEGVDALGIDLRVTSGDRVLVKSLEDAGLLRAYASDAKDLAFNELRRNGNCRAALLSGYLKDEHAIPELERWFLQNSYFYGWETSFPDALGENNYPYHYCYERALEHITSKPLTDVFLLTEAEISRLVMKYREGKQDAYAALYVLTKLRPEIADQEMIRAFRVSGESRFILCNQIQSILKPGMRKEEVLQKLGRPEQEPESVWHYDCGPAIIEEKAALRLDFVGETLVRARTVHTEQESYLSPLLVEAVLHDPQTKQVRFLAELGVDFSEPDSDGRTALGIAVEQNRADLVRLLLHGKGDVDFHQDGIQSPLLMTMERGNMEILQLLIAAGADVNRKNENGEPCLRSALLKTRIHTSEILILLINSGADVNAVNHCGESALHLAVYKGDPARVQILLSAGARTNMHDNLGRTPGMIAIEKGKKEILELLDSTDAHDSR